MPSPRPLAFSEPHDISARVRPYRHIGAYYLAFHGPPAFQEQTRNLLPWAKARVGGHTGER